MNATVIRKETAPIFTMPGLTVTGLASPKRGASETCVWRIHLEGERPGLPHKVTREEVFVALAGRAVMTIDGVPHTLSAGDAIIVPPNTMFNLANPEAQPFEAIVSFPVGGKAIADAAQPPFTPPWAE